MQIVTDTLDRLKKFGASLDPWLNLYTLLSVLAFLWAIFLKRRVRQSEEVRDALLRELDALEAERNQLKEERDHYRGQLAESTLKRARQDCSDGNDAIALRHLMNWFEENRRYQASMYALLGDLISTRSVEPLGRDALAVAGEFVELAALLDPESREVQALRVELAAVAAQDTGPGEAIKWDSVERLWHDLTSGRAETAEHFASVVLRVDQLLHDGQYRLAKQMARHGQSLAIRLFSDKNANTLAVRGKLAIAMAELDELAEAREIQERALDLSREIHGDSHAETLLAANNLALTMTSQGDFVAARGLLESRLRGAGDDFGAATRGSIAAMNTLGTIYQHLGDLSAAKELQERVVDISRRRLGPEDRDTLLNIGCLATTHYLLRDLERARALQEEVLEVSRRVLRAGHPDVGTAANNLANTLRRQGDVGAARSLYEEALAIAEKAFGAVHLKTAIPIFNLATLLCAQGDYDAARPLFERALAIRTKELGTDHRLTAEIRQALKELEIKERR
jgi:tetratricopeptide (TPR) repeat protein